MLATRKLKGVFDVVAAASDAASVARFNSPFDARRSSSSTPSAAIEPRSALLPKRSSRSMPSVSDGTRNSLAPERSVSVRSTSWKARRWTGRSGERLVEKVREVVRLVCVAHQVQRGLRQLKLADDGRPAKERGHLAVYVELGQGQHGWALTVLAYGYVMHRCRECERVDVKPPD